MSTIQELRAVATELNLENELGTVGFNNFHRLLSKGDLASAKDILIRQIDVQAGNGKIGVEKSAELYRRLNVRQGVSRSHSRSV